MNNASMTNALKKWAEERGCLITWSDAKVVSEVQLDFQRRRETGQLSEYLYRQNLRAFTYLNGSGLPNAKTVVVISMPRPAHKVEFKTAGGVFQVIVPPTYRWYKETRESVRCDLEVGPLKGESRIVILGAPLKALAARLGLVTYGRNNITYTPEFGSYHQLIAFLTDAELEPLADPKADATQISTKCKRCTACLAACPTGAIRPDRFMIDPERCVTLHSENLGLWPSWLPASAHNCIIGCMICQEVCPQNSGLLRVEPPVVSFDEDETATILANTEDQDRSGPTWDAIRAKFRSAGLADLDEVVSRNLRALLAKP
ncbi:MAG: 4Fe-4S double cluster binding domain-containing protein [Bacteroidota bacterium]